MIKSTGEYIRKYDPFQRRKEDRAFIVPLELVEEPTAPFQIISMGITGPYLINYHKNKYIDIERPLY